ncbi:hypothetical protein MMC19_005955 [Ptychographa xylographoides]|nr:hypothetical protein [Ptychographa xylographoides]
MPDVKRTIKIVTEQKVIDKPSGVEGFPLRKWNIQIFLLNEHGEDIPANVYSKATYHLHESFGKRAVQAVTSPPFKIQEEGWGEFDMTIVLTAMEKGGETTLSHDLNFQENRYETKHPVTFKNPKPALLERLRESGPVPGDENGKKRGEESAKKKKRPEKGVDMDQLAENLQRLHEDDLLQVVQMVHDHKSADSYTKNDVDAGEFHVDLYTLPDSLIRMLWDFSAEKVGKH